MGICIYVLKGDYMTSQTNIYKLLSDETRLRIMFLLYQQELCVCQLAGIINVPQPRISKNLAKLRDLNLVKDIRKDKYVYYSLVKDQPILNLNFKNMIENINDYPTLKQDQKNISNKCDYISQLNN